MPRDILVLGGGTIHESDIPYLKEIGVKAIFTPGTSAESILSTVEQLFNERECPMVGRRARNGSTVHGAKSTLIGERRGKLDDPERA